MAYNYKAHVMVKGTAYTDVQAPSYEEAMAKNEKLMLKLFEGKRPWTGHEYKDQVFKDVEWEEVSHKEFTAPETKENFHFKMTVIGYIDIKVYSGGYAEAEAYIDNALSDIGKRLGLYDVCWDVEKWEEI